MADIVILQVDAHPVDDPFELVLLALGLFDKLYAGFLTFLPTYLLEKGMDLKQAGIPSAIMLSGGLFAQLGGGLLCGALACSLVRCATVPFP